MPHFRPFLSLGLSNWEEHQVCAVAIGVVGDICRALEASPPAVADQVRVTRSPAGFARMVPSALSE